MDTHLHNVPVVCSHDKQFLSYLLFRGHGYHSDSVVSADFTVEESASAEWLAVASEVHVGMVLEEGADNLALHLIAIIGRVRSSFNRRLPGLKSVASSQLNFMLSFPGFTEYLINSGVIKHSNFLFDVIA